MDHCRVRLPPQHPADVMLVLICANGTGKRTVAAAHVASASSSDLGMAPHLPLAKATSPLSPGSTLSTPRLRSPLLSLRPGVCESFACAPPHPSAALALPSTCPAVRPLRPSTEPHPSLLPRRTTSLRWMVNRLMRKQALVIDSLLDRRHLNAWHR